MNKEISRCSFSRKQRFFFVLFALFLVCAVIAFYSYYAYLYRKTHSGLCEKPISYRIGEVKENSSFGVTRGDVMNAANHAAAFWNSALKKPLLVYSEDGELSINFFPDDEEKLYEVIDNQTLQNPKIPDFEKEKLKNIIHELVVTRIPYETAQAEYDAENSLAWEKLVLYKKNFAQLVAQGSTQKEATERLAGDKKDMMSIMAASNSKGEALPALLKATGMPMAEYNTILGKYLTPEEIESAFKPYIWGMYNPRNKTVNIYYYELDMLNEVLAHEFGHALGLSHNESENKSAMSTGDHIYSIYKMNTAGKEDIATLIKKCGTDKVNLGDLSVFLAR